MLKNKKKNLFLDILCFFAAKGIWPSYPLFMKHQVDDMGRYVFALNDTGIKDFCHGIFAIKSCFRPFKFPGKLWFLFFAI